MTPKQARFIDEYLIDLNATQAAIRAGYSAKTAEQIGHQLLKKASVAAEIDRRRKAMSGTAIMSATEVLTELSRIGRANMADYMRSTAEGDPYLDFSQLTRDQAAALVEVTVEDFKEGRGPEARDIRRVKFRLASKNDALQQLAKFHGLSAGEQPVQIPIPEVRTVEDITAATAAVLTQVSSGKLTPDMAGKVMNMLEQRRRSIETQDLAERIAAIEQAQGITGQGSGINGAASRTH
jgi:phage terminase small subunit